MDSKDLNRSKKIQEKMDSVFKSNLRTNEEKWVHYMCFKGHECLIADQKVLPDFISHQIEDPIECMTDEWVVKLLLFLIINFPFLNT